MSSVARRSGDPLRLLRLLVLAALLAHADVLATDSGQAGQVILPIASENVGSGSLAVHIAARALTLVADDSLGQPGGKSSCG